MTVVQDRPDIEKLPLEVDGIPVRETIREIFRNPENGTLDNISKAGCLALALKSNAVGGPGKGFVVWNEWGRVFPPLDVSYGTTSRINCPDFSGLRIHAINFSKFNLNRVSFSKTIFSSRIEFCEASLGAADFRDATFLQEAAFLSAKIASCCFDDATFLYGAEFGDATFIDGTSFVGVRFVEGFARFRGIKCLDGFGKCRLDFSGACFFSADFSQVVFPHDADFRSSFFGALADFTGVLFAGLTNFVDARFKGIAQFRGASFSSDTLFTGSMFQGPVYFSGAIFPHFLDFSATTFSSAANFEGMSWGQLKNYIFPELLSRIREEAEARELGPNFFWRTGFAGCIFMDGANFSNRKFMEVINFGPFENVPGQHKIDFGEGRRPKRNVQGQLLCVVLDHVPRKTRFIQAPIFHNSEIYPAISFDGVDLPDRTGRAEAAMAYRTLKLAFNKQQAVREEQRFFRLEMEEETLRETGIKRWLFRAYKTFSDYGFSVTRPLKYGGLGVLVLTLLYGVLSWAGHCGFSGGAGCRFAPEWIEFTLLQTLPLPGLDKLSDAAKSAFWPPGAYWNLSLSFLVIVHKTISLAALFLIGLALRNLFKLK
jgi:uncharacterized protein YjbI with pentapeptide repeats